MLRPTAIIVNAIITTTVPVVGMKSPIRGRVESPSSRNGYSRPRRITSGTSHAFVFDRRACARLARLVTSSRPLGRLFAEDAFRSEHEHRDQDPEDDRPCPVPAGRVPGESLVERLDESDHQRPDDGACEVADAAEHGRREGDQPELEARVVTD